jgi:hypothetical protein
MSVSYSVDRWDLNFRVVTNAHYHALRRSFYLLLSRSTNFAVIVSGTAGVASVLSNSQSAATSIGFLTAVLGTVQLVFDLDGMVRKHEALQKLYYELAAKITLVKSDKKGALSKLEANLHTISSDEPPVYKALQVVAHNITIAAYYQPAEAEEHLKALTRIQKIFKNWFRFANSEFPLRTTFTNAPQPEPKTSNETCP